MNFGSIKKFFKSKGSWDYELNFKETYDQFLKDIKNLRKEFKEGKITPNRVKAFTNIIAGLTQLRNGSRIGEAVEALNNFVADFSKTTTEVKVQKRKDKDKYYRKIILPEQLTNDDLEYIKGYIDHRQSNKENFIVSLSKFFQLHYSFSTHALRYAWINYMAKKKTPVNVIASITGHKTLDILLRYTQKKLGEDLLFNMFRKEKYM